MKRWFNDETQLSAYYYDIQDQKAESVPTKTTRLGKTASKAPSSVTIYQRNQSQFRRWS